MSPGAARDLVAEPDVRRAGPREGSRGRSQKYDGRRLAPSTYGDSRGANPDRRVGVRASTDSSLAPRLRFPRSTYGVLGLSWGWYCGTFATSAPRFFTDF